MTSLRNHARDLTLLIGQGGGNTRKCSLGQQMNAGAVQKYICAYLMPNRLDIIFTGVIQRVNSQSRNSTVNVDLVLACLARLGCC
jgi:hypothetical protein